MTAVQMALAEPATFQSLPHGRHHYVAALQNKPGELQALRTAPDDIWSAVTPLIEFVGPKSPGSEPFTRARVAAWVKKTADAVGARTVFLDRLRLAPNHSVATAAGPVPVLTAIFNAARRRGMTFVPVLHLGDVPSTAAQIADCAAMDGRGVALRVPLLGTAMPDGQSLPQLARDAVESTGLEIEAVDLIMDLRELAEDVELGAADLATLIEELLSAGKWRNVVLIATTMPRSLGGGVVEAGTIGRLPRKEWLLWLALQNTDLARKPVYGDYAVQHPDPPLDVAEGQIPLGLRGAIRYTHEEVTVVPRAKAPRYEEGREQYRQLCQLLVVQPEFAGCDYSWGDEQIANCADGSCDPGWEDHWRGAATSHHLRVVVDQLSHLS